MEVSVTSYTRILAFRRGGHRKRNVNDACTQRAPTLPDSRAALVLCVQSDGGTGDVVRRFAVTH